jgi:hypothetical protein
MQLWGSTVGSLRVAAGTIFNKVLIIVVTLAFLHFFSVQWSVTFLNVGQGSLGNILAVLRDNKDFLSLAFLNIQIMGLGVRLEI